MRRILRVMIAMLGPLGTLSALAQTPVPLPVTGNMGSISGGGTPYPGIDFQLQNCPAPITIPGYWGIIQTEYQVAADSSGVVNTTVWPNDLIDCNGTTGNSQYAVSYVLNGVTVSGPTCYQAVSTQGVWILNGPQQPISCTEPAPNPQDANFRNIYVSNLAQLNNVNITGTLNVSGAFSPPINIASGGTGATTANGAMLNLAGVVQSGTGTTQKDNFPGFVNGNVNGVFNVTTYGAVGDCVSSGSTAGCTNNTTAIQACVNAAYPVSGSCYFPTNPLASGQTIYYMAGTVNPKGVSLIGPPNGAGQINTGLNVLPIAIRGAPGLDMFAPGDPADAGYVALDSDWHVRDLAFLVDASVDASASHPYRKPGKTCTDAAIATGTAVLTSASNQCVLEPGDVGQAIKVTGAGAAGADLTTTISACTLNYGNKNNTCTSVTLAANASTTVTGATAYVSVMNLPVTATVGNCAFAFDQRVSQTTLYLTHPEFRDVTLQVTNSSSTNNTCGMFFQGNTAPYMGRFTNVEVGTFAYGYVFAPPSVGPITGTQFLGLSDFNMFQHAWNEAVYPFIAYGGNENTIQDWQLHSPLAMGVHILDGYNTGGGATASSWKIDIGEDEGVCQANSLTRIAGSGHVVDRFSFTRCTTGTLQWDAQNSTIAALGADTGTINVTGANNRFHSVFGLPTTINNTNVGNTFENSFFGSPFGGNNPEYGYGRLQSGTTQFATDFGVPGVSRGKIAFNRTADFLSTGAAISYFNKEDLWIWPNEVVGFGNNFTIAPDSTSESGIVGTTPINNNFVILGVNGVYPFIGKQIPAGLVRLYFKVKGSGSFSTTLGANVDELGSPATICTTGSVALTTSYSIQSCVADLTSYAGKTFNPFLLSGGAGTSVSIAWIGIRPWDADTITTSLKLGSTGTAMTGNQGTGLLVQHSTGALVSGNLLKADAAGNDIDAGFAASSVTTASSPTVGQAACIKAAGPPVVIGYCSTTVGAGGACTCN